MSHGYEFKLFLNPSKTILWNPDTARNGHIAITGGSGAGKTRLGKLLMEYLFDLGKNIHVVDVQNTLGMSDIAPEELFDFEVRNSPYSINPFEFLMDEKSGGPHAQTNEIMEMFRKSFMKRLKSAPMMSAVLRRLIIDTYQKAGVKDSDITTWGFDLSKKELNERLPVIADMKELVDYILDFVSGGYGAQFGSLVAKNGKILNGWHTQMSRLQEELRKIDEIADRDEDVAKKEKNRILGEINSLKVRISENTDALTSYFKQYIDFSFLGGGVPVYESLQTDEEGYGWLDFKYYSDKDRLKTISTIKTYIETLNSAGVFGRSTPTPSFSKINRYNLSSLEDEARIFCADILVSKIFRLLYLRGEYKSLPEGMGPYKYRRPNTNTDTALVIDEIQTLLPDTAAEAKNRNLLYNKMISQIRNFGGMVVAITQTPDNLPELFHTNIATMIILNTAANDIAKVKQVTGIKDASLFAHLEHKNKAGHYDVGLLKDKAGVWQSIRMPWYDSED